MGLMSGASAAEPLPLEPRGENRLRGAGQAPALGSAALSAASARSAAPCDKINEFCWSLAEDEAFLESGCSAPNSLWDPRFEVL